ncbi:septum formation initiator family protein [Candidatus Parcubacteria bacterium]|nr:septum formation initiator family protein [Candidatus Parcubacteria bacterium]
MIIKKKKKNIINKIFSFNLFLIGSVLIVVFLGTGLGKEFYRDYQIKKEIDSLQDEIGALEKDNYKLSQLIEYYKTDEYKEAEARERFSLKKDGESVVIVKSDPRVLGDFDIMEENKNLPNYVKWWNYFFASK